ncbi:type VII secretion target [Hamadaea sp. NPDC050747]|uniref:type VII secretion target n=1 Tax=Hamadaea sp. NPDC050747 TaxID=3155789 RepID=UPI003402B063
MQPGELNATPSAIVQHAGVVDGIAARVATAKQAGETVRVDNAAYGRLCTLLPPLINFLQNMVLDAITEADTSLTDTAARLRTAAGAYLAADDSSERDIRRIGTTG